MTDTQKTDIKELGETLLRVGSYLMSSGANSRRIRMTIERISGAFDCTVELLITHRALMLSISDVNEKYFHSSLKRTSPHGVNFRIVSGISLMSWKVLDEKWSIDQINKEIDRLIALPHFPRLVVLSTVALAGASFCRLSGGNYVDMLVTFVATFIGLYVRQEAVKRKFNPYMCVFFAAFTSAFISALFVKFVEGIQINAFSTSVLYLIPGVPLINSFSDFIDGNLMNGMVRLANGLTISLSIAIGLMGAMYICQI